MAPKHEVTPETVHHIAEVLAAVELEVVKACGKFGPDYHSAHEAYAVLLEEVDEFKDWVWRKREERVRPDMVGELVQVAAVAVKFAAQLCREHLAEVLQMALRQ